MKKGLIKNIAILILCILLLNFGLVVDVYAETISELDTPTGLTWKEGSTATATWNAVENANYYYVNVYVYDNSGNIIGVEETGTSNVELDVQQEIVKIMQGKSVKKYSVSFEVKAQYQDQNQVIESNTSIQSDLLDFEINGTIKYVTPQNLTIDDNYNVSFDSIANADYYALYFKMNNSTSWTHDAFLSPRQGTISNGKIKFNIENYIKESYKERGYKGETVQVSFKVQVIAASGSTTYLNSDESIYSNSVSFSNSDIIKYATPQNLTIDDNYNVSFDSIANADYYALYFKMNNSTSWTHDAFLSPRQGTISNGKIKFNIENYIKESYKERGYKGETVQVSFKVQVIAASGSTTYLNSDESIYSNSVSFSNSDIIKYATPQNLTIDDNYNVSFDSIANADYYALYFKMNNSTSWTHDAFLSPRQGTISNGKIKFNIKNYIKESYIKRGFSNETVKISYKVQVIAASGNTTYLNSDESTYSNIAYYNPNGSTIINSIILSPNKPVIAVGKSLYIGKTIEPNNAIYSIINWKSNNSNIVSIDNMGKITGVRKGNATITAQINNASQDAEVSVYEIASNINNSEENSQVIDKATDIITSIIKDEDTSNTDITNVNDAINEIETGAENGDDFNIDINYNTKTATEYSDIESQIKEKYGEDKQIAGGYDVRMELSHTDSQNNKHHIGNITNFDNKVSFEVDLLDDMPEIKLGQRRKYSIAKLHNNELELLNVNVNNNKISTSSNEFSDFILLYQDADMKGDVSIDSKVNITDVALINSHVKKVNILTGDELARADVNGDGKVNITDVALVNSHVKKVKMLED